MDWFIKLEESILIFFQSIRFEPLNSIMTGITVLGDAGLIWIAICIGLLFTKKYRKAGIIGIASLLLCFIANNVVIKNIVQRPRPFISIKELNIIIPVPSEFSFPSGHSSSSFAAATGIFLGSGKKFSFLFILAGLMAISRVYVGVHYLSDILVGALVGSLISIFIYKLSKKTNF